MLFLLSVNIFLLVFLKLSEKTEAELKLSDSEIIPLTNSIQK